MLPVLHAREDENVAGIGRKRFGIFPENSSAKIPLSEDQQLQLLALMPHYIGTKYPEDVQDLHRTYTLEFVTKTLNGTKELFQWLKNYLTSKKS